MESLLKRLNTKAAASAHEDPEDLWSDLEAANEDGLEMLTKQVYKLEKKVKKVKKPESSESEPEEYGEDFEEEEDGEDQEEEDEEEEDFDSEDDEDEMDPREQLRLLMEPCEDEDLSDDDEEDDEVEDEGMNMDDEDEEEEKEEDAIKGKKHVKYGLLDANGDDDFSSEDETAKPKSAFELQQSRLRRTIAALESENIAPKKDWTLRGEITGPARPQDSLLQEDLEFEHVAKQVPEITMEVTESLEELIRKRVRDRAWDDVEVRMAEGDRRDAERVKTKKMVQLDDTKSKLSLAQHYEQDFQAAQKKKEAKSTDLKDDDSPLDEQTKRSHDEVRQLFGKLCKALDDLQENKFAPRSYELASMEIKTINKK